MNRGYPGTFMGIERGLQDTSLKQAGQDLLDKVIAKLLHRFPTLGMGDVNQVHGFENICFGWPQPNGTPSKYRAGVYALVHSVFLMQKTDIVTGQWNPQGMFIFMYHIDEPQTIDVLKCVYENGGWTYELYSEESGRACSMM
jgi:hypothetical protein